MLTMAMNVTKSVLGRVCNCVGERLLGCETVASPYVSQPYTITMQISRFIYTVILYMCLRVWSELPHQDNTLWCYSEASGHSVYTCRVFVWYLLHTMTPPSHSISAYTSYMLFIIHCCLAALVLSHLAVFIGVGS